MEQSLFDYIFDTTGINLLSIAIDAAMEGRDTAGYDLDAIATFICEALDNAATEALNQPIVPPYPPMGVE